MILPLQRLSVYARRSCESQSPAGTGVYYDDQLIQVTYFDHKTLFGAENAVLIWEMSFLRSNYVPACASPSPWAKEGICSYSI
jgi:hypothetical protein